MCFWVTTRTITVRYQILTVSSYNPIRNSGVLVMRFGLFGLSAAMLATGAFAAQSAHMIAFSANALPQVNEDHARAHTSAAHGPAGRDEAIVLATR